MRFVVALCMLFVFVAGCLDAAKPLATTPTPDEPATKVWAMTDPILSQPIFPEYELLPLPLAASDGKRIDNWVFLPTMPEGTKIPAVVHFSPYFGAGLPNGGGGTDRILRENLTARGYAVVMQSVRGTGFSEGCFEIGGPRERQDYNELFDLIAAQPWSNGNVAAIGVSYDGTAPQGALISGSPHLKTIVPIAAISEWYKYNFVNAVQIDPQGYRFNQYYWQGYGSTPPLRDQSVDGIGEFVQTTSTRYCDEVIDLHRAQFQTAPTGVDDPYWAERNFTALLDGVKPNVSVLLVHGLVDYNVKTHNVLPWYQELQRHSVTTKAVFGQWGHAYPGTARPNGLEGWNLTLLRWFDYWLKGIDTGILAEPQVMIQDPEGVWRWEDDFPPSRGVPTKFYFDATGLVAQPGSGTSQFRDSGLPLDPGVPAPHIQSFRTEPFASDFRYSGEAIVQLDLMHSAPRGQVVVTVYNASETGMQPINWGYYGYNIRNGADRWDPILPNERFRVSFPLLPTDMLVPAGNHLVVELSGQDDPNVGPNMNPPPSGGTTIVYHGEASSITFPYLDSIEPIMPQPAMRGPAS